MDLTLSQNEIVNYIDGPLLVTAGPGSGKTKVLTQRIVNLINETDSMVLALTFSNKAAIEIKERLSSILSNDKTDYVLAETIHGFCLEVVLNKGNQIGLPDGLSIIENTNDKLEIIDEVIESLNLKNQLNNRDALLKIQKYKQEFNLPEMLLKDEKNRYVIDVYEAYNNILLNKRLIDFDDILFYAYRIFIEKPRTAKNYTRIYNYILIDEAQDLNDSQYKVIRALVQSTNNIMLVGDPSQSIYGFNGSNSKIMTENFVNDFDPKLFELKENFRSSANIIKAAKIVQPTTISDNVYPINGIVEINSFNDEKIEASWIVHKIKDILNDNGKKYEVENITLNDIAILGRNKYLFKEIEDQLSHQQLNYKFNNDIKKLESETEEFKIFENGLKVLANPFDDINYIKVVKLLNRKSSVDKKVNDLLFNKEINNKNLNVEIVQTIIESWKQINNDIDNFDIAIQNISDKITILNDDKDFRFLLENDLETWLKRWEIYCSQTVVGQRKLSSFLNAVSLGKLVGEDKEGISLITVHGSKGLEYSVVFIIGLNKGTFPDYRTKTSNQMKEERNNMFVAITRAKRNCFLSYVKYKKMPWGDLKLQEPSIFIKELKIEFPIFNV